MPSYSAAIRCSAAGTPPSAAPVAFFLVAFSSAKTVGARQLLFPLLESLAARRPPPTSFVICLCFASASVSQRRPIHATPNMMKPLTRLAALTFGMASALPGAQTNNDAVAGIRSLADRLFKGNADAFDIVLTEHHETWSRWNPPKNDNYTVSAGKDGKILVEGTTLSALSKGYVV